MAVYPRSDWLEYASRLHVCPLCAASDQYVSDYLDALCVRRAEEPEDDETAAVIRELCTEHTTAFELASRRAGLDASLVLAVHLSQLEQLADQLAGLDRDSWPVAPTCSLCLARNEVLLLCAHRLLAGMGATSSQTGRWLGQAGGLCGEHFSTCWEASSDGKDRDALRRVQLAAVQRLVEAAKANLAGDEFDASRARAIAERATAFTSS